MSSVFRGLELIDLISAIESPNALFPSADGRGYRSSPRLSFNSDNTKYAFYSSSNKLLLLLQGSTESANQTKILLAESLGVNWHETENERKREETIAHPHHAKMNRLPELLPHLAILGTSKETYTLL